MSYFEEPTNFCENMAVKLLSECNIKCKRNNLQEITAVDIITENNVKIDVQFSNNFSKYGDFRLDIVSAFTPKEVRKTQNYQYQHNLNFIRNFEKKFNCTVSKSGKILQNNYLDFFFILFYNKSFKLEEPDKILIIGKEDLCNYIRANIEKIFNNTILNNKHNLNDQHGSAFTPIQVNLLANHTNCFFGSIEEMKKKQVFIQEYLNLS